MIKLQSIQLPRPDAIAEVHSDALRKLIHSAIEAAAGQLSFARYMELALYAPGLGYYSAGSQKFGSAGDFVTAPEISPLFSRCIAKQCQPILETLGKADILEFGAGTGVMAADLLLELEAQHTLPNRYLILELSADLRQRQQATLQARCPHLLKITQWLNQLPHDFCGIILANEVVDAMPVHRFHIENNGIQELYVQNQRDHFVWHADKPSTPALTTAIQSLSDQGFLPAPYESEINLFFPAWLNSLSDCLKQGLILLIDYGFPRHEFYHPDRTGGTLMCHYRHHAHPDPLILPGLQDITAHVDFTQIAECATSCDLTVAGYTSQAAFLLGCGLDELATTADGDERQRLVIAQQIKKLTMPNEMGELFKVMALTRNLDIPLRGFALQDRRGRL